MARSYVVAFNRDRDFYQAPLALQESGALAGLVTDFYAPAMGPLGRLPALGRVARRRVAGLPSSKVQWNWPALRLQLADLPRAKSGIERIEIFKRLDRHLSEAALRLAARRDADLFLYSGYAREAFESPAAKNRRKGLFVFHPHGQPCLELLAADLANHPEVAESHRWHRTEIELSDSDRLDAEVAAADFLVCASSFTAASLSHVRRPHQVVTVAPYGCFTPSASGPQARSGPVRFLFVGQGVQRKGLHHLLRVWQQLRLPDAELTIVASSMDPGLRPLANRPGVCLLGAQSTANLQELYRHADVFVMPSLVEGFGLVYLEALAAGCFTIGTANTGLPDLCLPEWCADIVGVGNFQQLSLSLERAYRQAEAGEIDRVAIQTVAGSISWGAFRQRIREACLAPDVGDGGTLGSACGTNRRGAERKLPSTSS
jgi:glycosyltransferase involved in cell wall biosynthesis